MRNAQNRYFHFLHFVFVILLKFYETLKRDYVHTLVVTPLIIKIDALTVIRNTFVTRCDAQNFPDIDKVDCDTSIAMWDPTGQPSTVTDLFGDYNPFGNTSTSTASMVRIYCFWGINFFVNWPVTQQLIQDRRANPPPTVHAETVISLGPTQPPKQQNVTAVSTAELEVYVITVY